MIPYATVPLPGDLAGEFEAGLLVRLWARDGRHRIERVNTRTIHSFALTREDIDQRLAAFLKGLCSACGQHVNHEWELIAAPHDRMLCPVCAIHRKQNLESGRHKILGDREYIILNDTLWPVETPDPVLFALSSAQSQAVRVRIAYGDPITGRDWQEEFETTGYITRTAGAHVALLVHNRRSLGGGPLRANVVRITSSRKNGRVFYEHPDYHWAPESEAG